MNNSHIPLEEMLEDLRITNQEIEQYSEENRILQRDYGKNKVSIYLNEGRIGERRIFVQRLEKIIKETYPNHII